MNGSIIDGSSCTYNSNPCNTQSSIQLPNDIFLINSQSLSKEKINIFPNPSRDEFYIEWPEDLEVSSISIINSMGKKIWERNINNVELDYKFSCKEVGMKRGLYYINLHSKNHSYLYKVIRE